MAANRKDISRVRLLDADRLLVQDKIQLENGGVVEAVGTGDLVLRARNGRVIIEGFESSNEIDWQPSIDDFYDPTPGLPPGPVTGDRYIASATANGWTVNNIYEWDGSIWEETVPNEGFAAFNEADNNIYVFNGSAWVTLGSAIGLDTKADKIVPSYEGNLPGLDPTTGNLTDSQLQTWEFIVDALANDEWARLIRFIADTSREARGGINVLVGVSTYQPNPVSNPDFPATKWYAVTTNNEPLARSIVAPLSSTGPYQDNVQDIQLEVDATPTADTSLFLRALGGSVGPQYYVRIINMGRPLAFDLSALTGSGSAPSQYMPVKNTDTLSGLTFESMKAPTGISDRSQSTLSVVTIAKGPEKEVSIDPVGGDFRVVINGDIFLCTSRDVDSLTDSFVEGYQYLYLDTNAVYPNPNPKLNVTTDRDVLFQAGIALVGYFYWDAVLYDVLFLGDARHGIVMDDMERGDQQRKFGCQYESGFLLTPKTTPVPGTGGVDADAQVEFADGFIRIQDILYDINNADYGIFAPIAQIPVLYKSGAAGSWNWRAPSYFADNYPLIRGSEVAGTRCAFNELTGGSWQLTEASADGKYFAVYLFVSDHYYYPIFGVLGEGEWDNLLDARAGEDYRRLETDPNFERCKIVYRLIFQTDSGYANTPKARIVDVLDLREVANYRGYAALDVEGEKLDRQWAYPYDFDITLVNSPARGISAASGTPTLLYDDTTKETAYTSIRMPLDFDPSVDPVLRVILSPAAAQSAGSQFVIEAAMKYISNGEAVSKAVNETLTATVVVSNTVDIRTEVDITLDGSLMAAGDHATIALSRLPGDASDDRNGDAAIISAGIIYKVK